MNFSKNLKDMKGKVIHADDLIFYKKHYYRVFWNTGRKVLQIVSSKFTYLDLTRDMLRMIEIKGPYEGNEILFLSDGQVSF